MACCGKASRPRSSRCFANTYNIPLVHVEAAELFLGALHGISDPEEKRKIIGRLFVATFEQEAKAHRAGRARRA